MEFTIVTATTPDYEKKLRLCLPTWRLKEQFRISPILLFTHGYKRPEKHFKDLGKNVRVIDWNMNADIPKREQIFSAFVLGTGKYVETPHWVKLDSECHFISEENVFSEDDFKYDLFSHRWGYTKPATWIRELNEWSDLKNLSGEPYRPDFDWNKPAIGCKRIISFMCLHNKDFVDECAYLAGQRLPIPSHDTFLWYMAERLPHRTWASSNLKKKGVCIGSKYRRLIQSVTPIFAFDGSFLNTKKQIYLSRKHGYGYKQNLLNKVQLELTTDCNMRCKNCDRSCGNARSQEHMSVQQIHQFVDESLSENRKWVRIDLIGGEPTLHPEIDSIFEIIKEYKDVVSECRIRFSTNGVGKLTNEVINRIPKWVKIRNSSKDKKESLVFTSYNKAPCDFGHLITPFCDIPWRCGIGLSRYGYFPCGAGASLARVFGFDIGIKKLNLVDYRSLFEQIKVLCKYCGHSPTDCQERTNEAVISKSWSEAYQRYLDNKPILRLY